MCRVVAVILMLFASPCLANTQPKSYHFGECLGHETICDDEFNEIVQLTVDNDGTISTDIQFNHPHIVEVSVGKVTIDGSGFNSAHSIINNLGYEFTFKITGNTERPVAEAVMIHLGEEHLASITLIPVTQ